MNTFLDHLAACRSVSRRHGRLRRRRPDIAQAMDRRGPPQKRNNASFLAYPDGDRGLLEVSCSSPSALPRRRQRRVAGLPRGHPRPHRAARDRRAGLGALTAPSPAPSREGTSDFYALDYLVGAGTRRTRRQLGEYLGDWCATGHRRRPRSAYGPSPASRTRRRDLGTDAVGLREAAPAGRPPLHHGRAAPRAARALVPRHAQRDPRRERMTHRRDDLGRLRRRGMGYRASTDGRSDSPPPGITTRPRRPRPADASLTDTVFDEDGDPVADALVGYRRPRHGRPGARSHGRAHRRARAATSSTGLRRHPPADARCASPAYASDTRGRATSTSGHASRPPPRLGVHPPGRRPSSRSPGPTTPRRLRPRRPHRRQPATTVWGPHHGRSIVVDLGAPVDVAAVGIDPGAGCGDDDTAALGTPSWRWPPARGSAARADDPVRCGAPRGTIDPPSPDQEAVRYVQARRHDAPGEPGTSGEQIRGRGRAPDREDARSALGPTADTGAATAIGPPARRSPARSPPTAAAAPPVVFEYGTTKAYGQRGGGGRLARTLSAAVAGLAPSTLYHFRVVALRDGRRYAGANASFVTAGAPPPPRHHARAGPCSRRDLTADRHDQVEGRPQGPLLVPDPVRRGRRGGHRARRRSRVAREDDREGHASRCGRARRRRSASGSARPAGRRSRPGAQGAPGRASRSACRTSAS